MSELKATTAQEIVRNEKDCDYMDELFGGVKMPPTQVYLKSEADEVIAELKEIDSKNRLAYYKDLSMMAKDVEHQKYKRCMAMSKLCNEKWLVHNFAEISTKLRFYDKWEKRWLKIAGKFKEGV